MKIKFLITILFLLILANSNSLKKKINKAIIETFDIEHFEVEFILLPEDVVKSLPSNFSSGNFFKIIKENTFLGYAYVGKAPSKTDEFDFLVLLDKDLIVLKTKILAYREDYGGEISSKRWLKQFQGKSFNDELKYEQNIMAISGATISVRSMTLAMNNLLKSLNILIEKEIL